jgi:hypothetical protein
MFVLLAGITCTDRIVALRLGTLGPFRVYKVYKVYKLSHQSKCATARLLGPFKQ